MGSGATFPATAYTRWCQESGTCSYAAKGSGGGIKDLTAGTVAWAGSDAPLNSDEQAAIGTTVIVTMVLPAEAPPAGASATCTLSSKSEKK